MVSLQSRSFFRQGADERLKYLTQSSLNLAEISDVQGFAEPSAFSRAFARANGMPPLRFRQTQMRTEERTKL